MKPRHPVNLLKIPASAYKKGQAVEPVQSGPVVVVDTREKKPYHFDRSTRAALQTGDYSVQGLEHLVAVERKSKSDLYGTLSTARSRGRFCNELERARELSFFALVVECTMTDFRRPPETPAAKRRPYDKDATWRHLELICVRFNVSPWWCENRVQAQAVTGRLLAVAYAEMWREMDR